MGCKRKQLSVLFVCECVCTLKQKRSWSERERERERRSTRSNRRKTRHFFGQVQIFWLYCAGLQLDLIIDLIHRQAGRQAGDGRYVGTYLPTLWMDEF
jgi:hypothetical protein